MSLDHEKSEVRKVIIIGSGPAGLTAATYTARANLDPLLIHGPLPGGQLTTTTEVENFPGFPDGILGPELMQLIERQAKRFGAQIEIDTVTAVDLATAPYKVVTERAAYFTKALIVASGATPRYLGLPKERELTGYGVSTCATCDGAFYREKNIAIVGGGDSACEEALFLTRFGKAVYLIHRRADLRASKIMRERVLAHPKITPIWNSVIKEINGDKQAGVRSLTLMNMENGKESMLEADGLFIAIGHVPNSQLFKGSLDLDDQGYILHEPNSSATKVPGVFVCGDVQDHVYRQAVTAAGSGCMAAIEAERWLEQQHA